MKKTLVTALLALGLAQCAIADPNVIGFNIVSAHSHDGYNNTNPGVYARWIDEEGEGPAVGTYFNSEYKQSVWAAYVYERNWEQFSGAIMVGAVTGYSTADVVPMIVPSVAYHFDNKAIRIQFIPATSVSNVDVLHMSVEYTF